MIVIHVWIDASTLTAKIKLRRFNMRTDINLLPKNFFNKRPSCDCATVPLRSTKFLKQNFLLFLSLSTFFTLYEKYQRWEQHVFCFGFSLVFPRQHIKSKRKPRLNNKSSRSWKSSAKIFPRFSLSIKICSKLFSALANGSILMFFKDLISVLIKF